jgi:hypothetical protein
MGGTHGMAAIGGQRFYSFLRGLIEGTVTAEVLSFRNGKKKEDRIGESQPFRERTLFV